MAFFSRLEERKGIKVFVDALNMLDTDALALNQVTQPLQRDCVLDVCFKHIVDTASMGDVHARGGDMATAVFACAGVQRKNLRQSGRERDSLIKAPG